MFPRVLEKFYVGDLVTNELPVYLESGEFARTVKKRVKDHFKKLGISPKSAQWTFMRYFWIAFGVAFFWYLQTFMYRESVVGCLFASVGLTFFTILGGFNMSHDTSHFAITHKPWVWRLVGLWHDFINGMSQHVWNHQHTIGHHPYTNIDHADPDIITAADNLPDVRRIKRSQSWMPRYLYQHIYVPLLYGLLTWKMRLQDFIILLFLHKNGNIRFNKLTPLQWIVFFGGKAFFIFHRIVVPLLVGMSVSQLVFLLMFCEVMAGLYIAFTFQVSHVNTNVSWPLPDKSGLVHIDWWEMQVQTTQDYSTSSWLMTILTGSLNHQTAHHLFPGVAQCFYPIVTPIVKQTCEEFGIEYHDCGSFWSAIKSHIFHLKRLGQDEEENNKRLEQIRDKKIQ
jgi:fatty acid desaturase